MLNDEEMIRDIINHVDNLSQDLVDRRLAYYAAHKNSGNQKHPYLVLYKKILDQLEFTCDLFSLAMSAKEIQLLEEKQKRK